MAPTLSRIALRLGAEMGEVPRWAAPLGQRLVGGSLGAASGAGSAAIGDEVTTGHISRDDVIAGALAGFLGGAVATSKGARLAEELRSDRLPGFRQPQIDPRKFADYAMNASHPQNNGEWRAFDELGYDVSSATGRELAADDVIGQFVRGLGSSPARPTRATEWGARYETITDIAGPNGKHAALVGKWQLDGGTPPPKLITLWLAVIGSGRKGQSG